MDESRMHIAWGNYHALRRPGDADCKTAFEVAWRLATEAAGESAPATERNSTLGHGRNVFLLFTIDAGQIGWRAAFDTRDEAVAELNGLRPDGTSSIHEMKDAPNDGEVFTSDDCIEFAFLVESPHFVSFV